MIEADIKERHKEHGHHKPDIVQVKVVTTSGTYPRKGYEEAKSNEHVSKVLREASQALHLTDVESWVAKVDGREIDTKKTFSENDLKGEVCIQWNPREGGGGSL